MFCSVNGDNLGQTHIQTPEFIDDETESICCYVLKAHRATFLAVQWLRSAFNAGDMGSIPGPGTKIPHAVGQLSSGPQLLSLHAATAQLTCPRAHAQPQE